MKRKSEGLRQATMEERIVLNARDMCWAVMDRVDMIQPCPDPRVPGQKFCEFHLPQFVREAEASTEEAQVTA